MVHRVSYGLREAEQITQAVIAKRTQRHDQTVRRDCGDDAGRKRSMAVSRIEGIEVGRVGLVYESNVGLVHESNVGLVHESNVGLVHESNVGLVQKRPYTQIAGDKVVSASQVAGQCGVRVVDVRIDVGYNNSSSGRERRRLSRVHQVHRGLELVPVRCRSPL